jgi:DNA-binding transcriptional MerR regulator
VLALDSDVASSCKINVFFRHESMVRELVNRSGKEHSKERNRSLMTVGELAARVGVTVRTIQYYDQRGLLHPTCKGEQNLRLYSEADEERLYRIVTLKHLGLSLSEIQQSESKETQDELMAALSKREEELERKSAEILREMNSLNELKYHIESGEDASWKALADTVGAAKDRENALWFALAGESADNAPAPELSRDDVRAWHELMGDTIEAMHDGALVTDERAQELAARFSALGGMSHALAGLKRLANQRKTGPKQYGRDFYAGIQRRTLGFLQDALAYSNHGELR